MGAKNFAGPNGAKQMSVLRQAPVDFVALVSKHKVFSDA
jgi:hypothetical protein